MISNVLHSDSRLIFLIRCEENNQGNVAYIKHAQNEK